MNLKEYAKTQSFASGFPEGDTYLNLEDVDCEEVQSKFEDGERKGTKIRTKDGKEFFCPKSVLAELVKFASDGKSKVRITRSGKTKNDTRYTVLAQS